MNKHKLFNVVDFAIIRAAKNCSVKPIDIPLTNVMILEIDEKEVRISKDNKGRMIIKCPCESCGARGIVIQSPRSRILASPCRRTLAAYWFLIKKNGRISEIEINKNDSGRT